MATTNDLKNGITLNLDGNLWTVVEFQHVKPGKGGAFVRTKLKNVRTGRVLDKTFRAAEPVEAPHSEHVEVAAWHRASWRRRPGAVSLHCRSPRRPSRSPNHESGRGERDRGAGFLWFDLSC